MRENKFFVPFCIATWIVIFNLIAQLIGVSATWPLFMANILFFLLGGELKNLKKIFLGATTGLIAGYILIAGLTYVGPIIGLAPAFVIFLSLVLYPIIVLGSVVPLCFNDIAFAYLTISTIQIDKVLSETDTYLLSLWIGGGIFIASVVLLSVILEKKKGERSECSRDETDLIH